MGDLVRHRPGRVTACSLSGEGGGRGVGARQPQPVTVLGVGGREGERGRRPIAAAKRGGIQQDVVGARLSGGE